MGGVGGGASGVEVVEQFFQMHTFLSGWASYSKVFLLEKCSALGSSRSSGARLAFPRPADGPGWPDGRNAQNDQNDPNAPNAARPPSKGL